MIENMPMKGDIWKISYGLSIKHSLLIKVVHNIDLQDLRDGIVPKIIDCEYYQGDQACEPVRVDYSCFEMRIV